MEQNIIICKAKINSYFVYASEYIYHIGQNKFIVQRSRLTK